MTPITITTSEGVFVFVGTDPNGAAKWNFLKRTDDGLFPSRAPRSVHQRFERHRRDEVAHG